MPFGDLLSFVFFLLFHKSTQNHRQQINFIKLIQTKSSIAPAVFFRIAMSSDDEFGDASFLENFDVDQVVAKTRSPPAKRAKVSPGTYTTNHISTAPPDKINNASTSSSSLLSSSLDECLQQHFGYSSFRPGQKHAIEAILSGRDVAVFWATGSGKSICYQLPAIFQQEEKAVALVVSPLISLMQDQVHKLNSISEKNIATFLGSAQHDPTEETKAMRGTFRLVYVTPEKLVSSGFLSRISRLNLCLIAVDESHCVSQWGHDFRRDYRQAGAAIRNNPQLARVPIMALTATALPSIQQDIISSLRMQNPVVCLQTFDRTNLAIRVSQKASSDPLRAAMEPLIQTLKTDPSATIIYGATRNDVERIAQFLQQRLEADGCSHVGVEMYHAGLSDTQRYDSHLNFLTGKTSVMVATIAFGMGIDKTDTRRVIHFGPPKSFEEYYQHIGRAGRDGLPAECIMYVSASDFDKYKGDFYIGSLTGRARQASIESTDALKSFALSKERCRRKMILDFFQEKSSFGERCGTCDNCKSVKMFGDDATRDFGSVAILILTVVSILREASKSVMEKVLNGNDVEPWRFASGAAPKDLLAELQEKRKSLNWKLTTDQIREFTVSLVQQNYIKESTKTTQAKYRNTYNVYGLTSTGHAALRSPEKPIMLPVPDSIREAERLDAARREKSLKRLKEKGVQIDKLPREEIEKGDGECIRAFTKWHNYVDQLQNNGRTDRVTQLEELVYLIQEWRFDAAVRNKVAPASILPEHIMYMIAYTSATLPRNVKVDKESLVAVGARSRELDSLADILNSWSDRQKVSETNITETKDEALMNLAVGPIHPPMKWPYAVYKPNKKTGKAAWEASYDRFSQGENIQVIAMTPASGRPIQVNTVVGHIQDALLLGRPVDLRRLSEYSPLPTKSQWSCLENAEKALEMDATGDPTTSGALGEPFRLTDLLRPIIGEELISKSYEVRTDEEKALLGEWMQIGKWYLLLRRIGIAPTFGGK